ncbi:MAG: outer membrane beta-barrel protein, partial [Polaromonas sp.]|nr:outer membrane beta-barrel protein [Polaromonas sp.]
MTASKFPAARRRLGLVALAVLGTVSSSWVIAQDETTGAYIGGNVGRTRADFNNDSINRTLAGQGLAVRSMTEDDSGTGYKAFGGYQLNRNFAIEGGYFDLGRFNYAFDTTPAGTFNGNTRVRGLNLDLVGILPLSDRFSVFGRAGAAYAQSRANFTSTGAVPVNTSSSRRNDTNLKVGLGMQYAITEALAVRAELERYRVSDPVRNRGHIDMASVGLVYRFGGKVQTPVAQAYVPVVTAPPPPPAPVYVAPPPPPPPAVVVAPAPAPQPVYEPAVRPAKQG